MECPIKKRKLSGLNYDVNGYLDKMIVLADKILWSYPVYALIYHTVGRITYWDSNEVELIYHCRKDEFMELLKDTLIKRYGFVDLRTFLKKNKGHYSVRVINAYFIVYITFSNNNIGVYVIKNLKVGWDGITYQKFK